MPHFTDESEEAPPPARPEELVENLVTGFRVAKQEAHYPLVWLVDDVVVPAIRVSSLAHTAMYFLTTFCPVEVKWYLECRHDESGEVPAVDIVSVVIPWQTVSAGHAATLDDDDQRLIELLQGSGMLEHLWGSGHSHHHMPVYTSAQDSEEIKRELSRKVRVPGQDLYPEDRYIVRVITNKKLEWEWTIVDVKSGIAFILEPEMILAEPCDLEDENIATLLGEFQERVSKVQPKIRKEEALNITGPIILGTAEEAFIEESKAAEIAETDEAETEGAGP